MNTTTNGRAITTKFTRAAIKGARISATGPGGKRMYFGWEHEWSADVNHALAACKFRDAMGWTGEIVSANLPDSSMVHIVLFTK